VHDAGPNNDADPSSDIGPAPDAGPDPLDVGPADIPVRPAPPCPDEDEDGWCAVSPEGPCDPSRCPHDPYVLPDCDDSLREVHPRAVEQCNGRDDDCDAFTDTDGDGEALTRDCYEEPVDVGGGQAPTRGVGICSDGEQICLDGDWSPVCDGQVQPAAEDICNGLDDDCDGLTDTTPSGDPLVRSCYTGDEATRGVGACSDGEQVCQSEAGWGRCLGDRTPEEELCNGLDDDCDGPTDQDAAGGPLTRSCYSGPEGTLGVGVCWAGVETCLAGEWSGRCEGERLPLAQEYCNGLDDDCEDGVDEDFGVGNPCLEGTPCGAGVVECVCTARDDCGSLDDDPRWLESRCSTAFGGSQFPGGSLSCGDSLVGVSTADGVANAADYDCAGNPYTWTGRERVYVLQVGDRQATVRIEDLSTPDLDLVVYRGCTPAQPACVGVSDRTSAAAGQAWDEVRFQGDPLETYYVVVETYEVDPGADLIGTFSLQVTCN